MELITYLGILCITYLFVYAEPIVIIKEWFNISNESEYINYYQWFILKLVNCTMCSGFWIGLIFYQSILFGALVSIGCLLLEKIINRI